MKFSTIALVACGFVAASGVQAQEWENGTNGRSAFVEISNVLFGFTCTKAGDFVVSYLVPETSIAPELVGLDEIHLSIQTDNSGGEMETMSIGPAVFTESDGIRTAMMAGGAAETLAYKSMAAATVIAIALTPNQDLDRSEDKNRMEFTAKGSTAAIERALAVCS